MPLVMKGYWFVMRALLAAFVALCIARVIRPAAIPSIMPLSVILLAWAMLVLAGIADGCCQVWFLYRERLQALCIGISLKPFDWRLGDVTRAGYPGRWWALGPLRIGGKTRRDINPLEITEFPTPALLQRLQDEHGLIRRSEP
jgi:hypothetical protein